MKRTPGGGNLKILGGAHRGRRLETPPGKVLRPMRSMVREALFNVLNEWVGDARVLDLFAGSGSLGLEALSRGARAAVFVERAAPCLAVLRRNVDALGLAEQATIVRYDLAQGLAGLPAPGPFELVLIHPPFELLREGQAPELDVAALLGAIGRDPRCGPETRIAFETPRGCYEEEGALPELEVLRRRDYGSTTLFVARPRHKS